MSTSQPIRSEGKLQLFKQYYRIQKQSNRNYALIITGLNTALRISDILHIKWNMVYDFDNMKWYSHISIREQKTGKINRIFLNEELKAALEEYKSNERNADKSVYIFRSPSDNSRPLSRTQAFRIIKQAADYAGLGPNISCHSLRKTFGYHAWKQGVSPALLVDIYNHSSYQVTRRYLCIDQDDRDEVFEKIRL